MKKKSVTQTIATAGKKQMSTPENTQEPVKVETPVEQPAVSAAPDAEIVLIGTDSMEAAYRIGDEDVALGTIVAKAFEVSGLDAQQWNGLEEGDRNARLLQTLDELIAASKAKAPEEIVGELTAPQAPAKEETPDLVAPTPEVEEAAAAEEDAPDLTPEELVLEHLRTLFPNVTILSTKALALVNSLEQYIGSMAYNQVVMENVGALRQRRMYHDILGALTSEDWNIQAEILLFYFAKYRDTHFQTRLIHRFVDVIGLQTPDRLRFEALMRLFTVGADTASRKLVAREIDFRALTDLFKDNLVKEHLLAVFKVE